MGPCFGSFQETKICEINMISKLSCWWPVLVNRKRGFKWSNLKKKKSYGDVNPFTGIWLKTRETVRYVIEEKSMGFVILLMILSGISSALVGAFDSEMNQMMPVWGILLGSIIAGPIFILLIYAIMAGVYFITGKLFKGTGTYTELF
ncbi:YIP1 family protein [Planococcus glaciei]|nr:YIP1 family protein [Planococcus glaciei]